jgi:hypothetical protein
MLQQSTAGLLYCSPGYCPVTNQPSWSIRVHYSTEPAFLDMKYVDLHIQSYVSLLGLPCAAEGV